MTWTYTDPNTYPRDEVRLAIGDTDSTDPLLTDEEIAYFIAQTGSAAAASASACRAIAAKMMRLAMMEKAGEVQVSYSDRANHYFALADQLSANWPGSSPVPVAGGVDTTDHKFEIDMMTNYGSSVSGYEENE